MSALFGTVFALLLPPILPVIATVGFWKDGTHWKRYIGFYVLTAALLAFSYVPLNEPDLVRYFEMLDDLKRTDLFQGLRFYDDGLIVKNFLFWLVAKTGINALLPAISTGTVYFAAAYMTCKTAELWNMQKYIGWVLLLQTVLLPYLSIVNNVRNICTFSLILLAVYRELILKKRNLATLLLYVLPCFIHDSAIVLIALRAAAALAKRWNPAIIAGVIFIPSAINLAYRYVYLFDSVEIVHSAILKAYWYMNDTDTTVWATAVSKSLWQRANRFAVLLLVAWIAVMIYHMLLRRKNEWYAGFSEYLFLLCLVTLACNIFTTPQYWRFAAGVLLAAGGVLIPILALMKKNSRSFVLIPMLLYGMGYVFLQLWQAKSIADVLPWMSHFITDNVYVILYTVLQSMFRLGG